MKRFRHLQIQRIYLSESTCFLHQFDIKAMEASNTLPGCSKELVYFTIALHSQYWIGQALIILVPVSFHEVDFVFRRREVLMMTDERVMITFDVLFDSTQIHTSGHVRLIHMPEISDDVIEIEV
jgi:hypothetical protein